MGAFAWIVLVGSAGAIAYSVWRFNRNWQDRTRESEARMASLMAQARPQPLAQAQAATVPQAVAAATPAPGLALAQQRLLFEAASKAGEAGEPVLAIQIYARLLSRYPESGFATEVRAAVEVQKKRLAKR